MKKARIVQIKNLDEMCKALLVDGETFASLSEISVEELERIYTRGYESYHAGRYDEALVDFTYLVMHQPWDRRFHMALGSALHQEGEFQHALKFYGYALFMDACDPTPTLAIAQCLLALGEQVDAREALQTAIEQSYSDPKYHSVKETASALLEKLN